MSLDEPQISRLVDNLRLAMQLFCTFSDEIEDLTPEERDVLVRRAFQQHGALQSRYGGRRILE